MSTTLLDCSNPTFTSTGKQVCLFRNEMVTWQRALEAIIEDDVRSQVSTQPTQDLKQDNSDQLLVIDNLPLRATGPNDGKESLVDDEEEDNEPIQVVRLPATPIPRYLPYYNALSTEATPTLVGGSATKTNRRSHVSHSRTHVAVGGGTPDFIKGPILEHYNIHFAQEGEYCQKNEAGFDNCHNGYECVEEHNLILHNRASCKKK